MTHNPRMKWIALGVCFVVGMGLGFFSDAFDDRENPGLFMAMMVLVATAIILPASIVWWRSLDELAREAHKSAWFWGGSFGLVAITPVLLSL